MYAHIYIQRYIHKRIYTYKHNVDENKQIYLKNVFVQKEINKHYKLQSRKNVILDKTLIQKLGIKNTWKLTHAMC
jgi:hypothetical protein